MKMDFYLSSKSLKNIIDSKIDEDFTIEIFDESIKCSKFVALFLSKEITKLYLSDPTIDRFEIKFGTESVFYSKEEELKQMIEDCNFLFEFKQLLRGSCIQIGSDEKCDNETRAKILFELGKAISNDEMIEKSLELLGYSSESTEQSPDKSIRFLKLATGLGYEKSIDRAYDIIASNFPSIIESQKKSQESQKEGGESEVRLGDLCLSDLERILSSSELVIESEDWLFEFITSLGPEFFALYDYVAVEYLSAENISRLIDNIDNYELSLHSLLWSSICRRLKIDVKSLVGSESPRSRSIRPASKLIECENGIFKYLSETTQSNVYESRTIDVETSQVNVGEIKNMFDHSKSTDFRVRDGTNSFIIFDFKDKKVNLSKYYFSVPERSLRHNSGQPKTWLIEGSNDKSSWETIDSRENEESLNDCGKSNAFSISNNKNNFYRFIRIKEISDCYDDHYLLLSEVEFYGSLQYS